MSYQKSFNKLSPIHQTQLLNYFNELTNAQQDHLLTQIEQINLNTLKLQQQLLRDTHSPSSDDILPFPTPSSSGNHSDFIKGKELIASGAMGCLIVAGGQGTRLRSNGPKGIFPVSPYEHKSLFQLFSEKVISAGKQANRLLPLTIMTSPENHQETIAFFEEHRLFGLHPSQISFFSQGSLPLLDQSGNLFLSSKDSIAMGPDGNGMALHHFFHSGIWSKWNQHGVKVLNFVLIDNPLADPYDAELLGYHMRCQNEVTIKCISRKHAQEKVGVLAHQHGKTRIVEYSELPQSLAESVQPDGSLLFSYANISLFCFNMDFIKKVANNLSSMPLHKAFKACDYLDFSGRSHKSEEPIAWKFETFIFDLLPLAEKVGAILYPRERCFSPLKNYEGNDSITTVRQALLENDQRVFLEATGKTYSSKTCDVSQDFYYPTPGVIKSIGSKGT